MSTWTDPLTKSWPVGYQVEENALNQFHRDNMNATMHRLVYKLVDEPLTTNTTLQDDDDFRVDMGANETWFFQVQPMYITLTTAAIKFAFTVPSGTTFALSAATYNVKRLYWSVSGTSAGTVDSYSSTGVQSITIGGVVFTSSTPGSFKMQWAQVTSSGTTTMKAGSTLFGQRIVP